MLAVAWGNVNKIELKKYESAGEEGTWWGWINKIHLRKSLENLALHFNKHNSMILAYVQEDKPWSIIYFKYSLNIKGNKQENSNICIVHEKT